MTAPRMDFHVDVTDISKQLSDLAFEQIPYATSRALNDLAFAIRDEERVGLRQRMTIRKDWVVWGWGVTRRSNKNDVPMTVEISIDPKRYFLNKFEDGGMRAASGHRFTVPTPSVKRSKADTVAPTYRPKNLEFHEHTTKAGKVQLKGKHRTFIIETGPRAGIYARTGKGKDDVVMLWKFRSSVPTPAILKGHATAAQVIAARFEEFMIAALKLALGTAR